MIRFHTLLFTEQNAPIRITTNCLKPQVEASGGALDAKNDPVKKWRVLIKKKGRIFVEQNMFKSKTIWNSSQFIEYV